MTSDRDTIFALSSGRPPAAIAVIRVSGPRAGAALERLIGRVPQPRRASLAQVRDPATHHVIDEGLVLWFPGPNSATGEDVAELHVHGGRAGIVAVLSAPAKLARVRHSGAGEATPLKLQNRRPELTAVQLPAARVATGNQGRPRHD